MEKKREEQSGKWGRERLDGELRRAQDDTSNREYAVRELVLGASQVSLELVAAVLGRPGVVVAG
ncbi:hypothetical protein E2C01_041590 [Portunus trituberculatus]|uniref:Uncharacterized protein n=1 Tax=Portunus trituberculatus TaxID=210409 RepID=A0A5B7FMZ7_PORTR|nr:hypothetical protein [Portunus trituberculatus]